LRTARHRPWLGVGITVAFMLVVASGVADQGWEFAASSLVIAGLAVGGLHLIFPHGLVFALGAANGLAIYVCVFVVVGQAAFPDVEPWSRSVAFLLPVLAFVAACWRRRTELGAVAAAEAQQRPSVEVARWLAVSAAVGIISLVTPINRAGEATQTVALVVAMAGLGAIGAVFVADLVRLLVDIATVTRQVGRSLRRLAVPIATYVSLFGLLAVAFGCFYRISDGLSRAPIFMLVGVPSRISFSDAMHFSVVTLSTVGYGDIQPHDDGVRLLAAIQMVLGQLLLLFGFAEIMRGRARDKPVA
jgi:hypothetical protein